MAFIGCFVSLKRRKACNLIIFEAVHWFLYLTFYHPNGLSQSSYTVVLSEASV